MKITIALLLLCCAFAAAIWTISYSPSAVARALFFLFILIALCAAVEIFA